MIENDRSESTSRKIKVSKDLSMRDHRQRQLVPPEKLKTTEAIVIGCGAIGRQVALQLAAIGIPRLILVDFDKVSAENLNPQGFFESDLGSYKVSAVKRLCKEINNDVKVKVIKEPFTADTFGTLEFNDNRGIFACVDDMDNGRIPIWDFFHNRSGILIDGRMSARTIRILVQPLPAHHTDAHYAKTLFRNSEAQQEGCTNRTTIGIASAAAGIMVDMYTKLLQFEDYLNNVTHGNDFIVDLLGLTMKPTQTMTEGPPTAASRAIEAQVTPTVAQSTS